MIKNRGGGVTDTEQAVEHFVTRYEQTVEDAVTFFEWGLKDKTPGNQVQLAVDEYGRRIHDKMHECFPFLDEEDELQVDRILKARKHEPMTEMAVKAWVAGLIHQAWELVTRGLHPAHKGDIKSWAADFFIGDFPWDDDRKMVVKAFMSHPDYPDLRRLIKEKFGFDMSTD